MDKTTLLRAGVRQFRTMASERLYLRTGLDVTAPITISAEVNDRCNYKCRYCHYWRKEKYSSEMSIEDWQRVLLSLRNFLGRYIVQFTGGEAFVKKGFVDLLEFCCHHRIEWGLITNGSALSSGIVQKIVSARPLNIDISVDSPDAAVNDFVRGAPDSLDAIGSGMKRLSDLRRTTGRHFPIRVKATLTRINFRSLPQLSGWATEHGVDAIDLHPVHSLAFWTPELRSELIPHDDEIKELRAVLEVLIAQKRNGAPIETPVEKLRTYPDQFLGRVVRTSTAGPCRAGMRNFFIRPNGDVLVCWSYPSIGNLRIEEVRDIWYSENARAIRAQTITCPKLGKECANTCLDSRTLAQEVKRAIMLVRRN